MTRYTATTHHDGIDIEWNYDVLPGYPGSRIDPPEDPSVDNLSARFILGDKHWPVPDELVESLRDDASLLVDASEQYWDAADEAADWRQDREREDAA